MTTSPPSNKKTTNLSTQELLQLELKNLDRQQRISIQQYQIGKVKTWQDLVKSSGLDTANYNGITETLNVLNIKRFFEWKKESLITKPQSGKSEPIVEAPLLTDVQQHYLTYDKSVEEHYDKQPLPKSPFLAEDHDEFTIIECLRNNPHIQYFPKQEKHASSILRHLIKYGHRSRALSAGVGTGKTFMLAAVIKELWRRNFPALVNSISPFPCLYITRATVVEQTERVLFNQFGLRPGHEVTVTNIDQLRSKLGESIVNERIVVEHGVEHTIYTWYEMMAPGLIVLDEAHAVKNVDSKQSRIMQSFNDLGENHISIYSSATLFTRVIEAKCFAVSTQLKW